MPLGVSVRVDTSGIATCLNELQTRNATLKAVRGAIKIVQAAVKPRAPKRFGYLKSAQGTKAGKGKKGKTPSYAVQGAKTQFRRPITAKQTQKISVSAKKRDVSGRFLKGGGKTTITNSSTKGKEARPAFYDHLVIGGVKAHGVAKGGGVKEKRHPGARANPYREQAYNSVKSKANAEAMRIMAVEIDKITAKAEAKLGVR